MNDIQAKENIYNAVTTAVNKQQESVSVATTQVTQAQNAYLQSVVRVATLSEKNRRKSDFLINTAAYGGIVIIGLVLLLINFWGGVLYIVAVGLFVLIVKENTVRKRALNYNNRRAFFAKYAYAVPDNEQLEWKNVFASHSGSTSYNEDGWDCPKCSARNSNGSIFCDYCGTKK